MKPIVLIADRYADFLTRLEQQLKREAMISDAYDVIMIDVHALSGQTEDGMSQALLKYVCGSDGHLELRGTTSDSKHSLSRELSRFLPAQLFAVILPETIDKKQFYDLCPDFRPCADNITILHFSNDTRQKDSNKISRFSAVSDIHRLLLSLLPNGSRKANSSDRKLSQIGTLLAFSESFSERACRFVMHRAIVEGVSLIYVPIMPLYRLKEPFQHGPGKTLGDLIDRVNAHDPPQGSHLGRWLYWHENGYYTFRLPERADDLIACTRETLRQLVQVIRSYARSREEKMTVWIDARGLPLIKRQAIASFCDFIYVETPDEVESSASVIARRELSLFLAELPGECDILELPRSDKQKKEVWT
ncbi:MAG: hypothetical protein ACOX36_00910 [Saccharofermentanales bacterium]|jgi:hypothetical protein